MDVVADEKLVRDLCPSDFGDVVTPVDRRTVDTIEYVTKYDFDSVVMDFDPSDVFVSNATWNFCDDGSLVYKYPGKQAVLVTEDGVHPLETGSRARAEKQSYFVLSQLDAQGYVRRFRKVEN